MKKFDVIEDNGGGLALIVYTDDRTLVEYVHRLRVHRRHDCRG